MSAPRLTRLGNTLGANEKVDIAKMVDQRALPANLRTNLNVFV